MASPGAVCVPLPTPGTVFCVVGSGEPWALATEAAVELVVTNDCGFPDVAVADAASAYSTGRKPSIPDKSSAKNMQVLMRITHARVTLRDS